MGLVGKIGLGMKIDLKRGPYVHATRERKRCMKVHARQTRIFICCCLVVYFCAVGFLTAFCDAVKKGQNSTVALKSKANHIAFIAPGPFRSKNFTPISWRETPGYLSYKII